MKGHFILLKSLKVNVMDKFLDVCLGLGVLLFGGTLVWYVANMFITLI
jgi:hypothetical protein